MRRVLALDVGSVRIGVAITDPLGVFAQALDVWEVRSGGRKASRQGEHWRAKLERCFEQYDPELVVVGLPLRTDGTYGPEAERIVRLVENLRKSYPDRTFATWDERYTTTIAQQALLEGDVSRRKRKERVDKVAATLILQSWLSKVANSESD